MTGSPAVAALGRRLRLGIVGGGGAALIGPVHRRAARLDDLFEIPAAALASDPARSLAEAARLGVPRGYPDLAAMLAGERGRPDGIDALAICTPNDTHAGLAAAALDAGLHVICDKPLTNDLGSARALVARARAAGRLLALTHNYSGYPMVRQARAMVAAGELGRVHLASVTYVQGSLGERVEADPARVTPRLRWRLDPARGGASHVMGDIGTHAHQLLCFVVGRRVLRVTADIGAVVAGRTATDDTGMALLELEGGAKATFLATKAATGSMNGLGIEVHGEGGGLAWRQAAPDELLRRHYDRPFETYLRGGPGLHPAARRATRLPAGHPEGFTEAFANLYADFAEQVAARLAGTAPDPLSLDLPTAEDGALGLAFVEACLLSSAEGRCRVEVPGADA